MENRSSMYPSPSFLPLMVAAYIIWFTIKTRKLILASHNWPVYNFLYHIFIDPHFTEWKTVLRLIALPAVVLSRFSSLPGGLLLRGGCLPCLLVIPFFQNDSVLYLQGLNFRCELLDLQWIGFSAFPRHPAHPPRHGQPSALPTCDPFSTRHACHLAFPVCRPVSLPILLIWAHLFILYGFCFLISKWTGLDHL